MHKCNAICKAPIAKIAQITTSRDCQKLKKESSLSMLIRPKLCLSWGRSFPPTSFSSFFKRCDLGVICKMISACSMPAVIDTAASIQALLFPGNLEILLANHLNPKHAQGEYRSAFAKWRGSDDGGSDQLCKRQIAADIRSAIPSS